MNLNRKNIFGVVALLFAAYATPSLAGFEIVDEPTADKPVAAIVSGETSIFSATPAVTSVNATRVVHVGKVTPASITGLVEAGQGNVNEALRLLTPKDWQGYKRGAPDLTKAVKWSGNQSWSEALNEALGQTNLMVELDWTKKKASVFSLPEKIKVAEPEKSITVDKIAAAVAEQKAVKAKALVVKTPVVVEVKSPVLEVKAPVVVVKPAVIVPPVVLQTWEIKSGETLRTALNRWMVKLNWQPVVWEVQNDFELKAAATFTGDIDDALRKVADSAGINILMYKGNHVCVVREGSN